jgi:acid phosphatase (class A)
MSIARNCWPVVVSIGAFVSGCTTKSPTLAGAGYLPPDAIDIQAVIPDPPADNSPAARAELDQLLAIQGKRTPEEVARIKAEGPLTPYLFTSVLGPSFKAETMPATDALLKHVTADATAIIGQAKTHWDRKRPWVLDGRIQPCIAKPTDASYPSARAVRSCVWATILGELFPAKKAQLLAAADQVAQNRIDAGVHYPSDITAGKALGRAIAAKIMQTPAFTADVAAAQAEWAKVAP